MRRSSAEDAGSRDVANESDRCYRSPNRQQQTGRRHSAAGPSRRSHLSYEQGQEHNPQARRDRNDYPGRAMTPSGRSPRDRAETNYVQERNRNEHHEQSPEPRARAHRAEIPDCLPTIRCQNHYEPGYDEDAEDPRSHSAMVSGIRLRPSNNGTSRTVWEAGSCQRRNAVAPTGQPRRASPVGRRSSSRGQVPTHERRTRPDRRPLVCVVERHIQIAAARTCPCHGTKGWRRRTATSSPS